MGGLPLHPVVVHFPLVLAILVPIIAAGLLFAEWRGWVRRRAWWVGVSAGALLTASAFVALKTGEREEDRVERVVAESAIETHEERAEAFLWSTVIALVLLAGAGVVPATRLRRVVAGAALVAALAAGGLALAVGHSGGTLVYVHNAGAAYTNDATERTTMGGDVEQRARDDDDH